ncbi:MAG TPA: hypothetical protein VK797_22730 [Tepidisphaeraceae bacterium]|jgi:hypothetical protein|nr:hypothetical protein [Tepidisphaeraceae bacterium]
MAERTEQITFWLRAKDMTAEAYKSAKEKLENFIHESRGGARLLEHGLKLGGAGIVVALLAEGLNRAAEGMRAYTERVSEATDAEDLHKAKVQGMLDVVSSIDPLVGALDRVVDAYKDLHAEQLKEAGASDKVIDRARSDAGTLKYLHEKLEETTRAYHEQRSALNELAEARAQQRPGMSAEGAAVGNAARAAADRIADLRKELEEYKKHHFNPTELEKGVIAQKDSAIEDTTKAAQIEIENIHDKFRREERDRNAAHNERLESDDAEHEIKLRRLAAEADAEELHGLNESFEAEQVLRDNQYEEEKRRADLKLNDDLNRIRDEAQKRKDAGQPPLNDAAERERAYRQHDQTQKAIDAQKTEADHRATIEHQNQIQDEREERRRAVMSAGLEMLHEEAELGSNQAKKAATILEIHEKFNEKREEFNKLLREGQDLTADERKQIEAARDATVGVEKAAIARAGMPEFGPFSSPFAQSPELKFGQDAGREAFAANARQAEQTARAIWQKQLDAQNASNTHLQHLIEMARQFLKDAMAPAGL